MRDAIARDTGGTWRRNLAMVNITRAGEHGVLTAGIMGGPNQPLAHAQFVSNVVDYGMNVQEAMETARMFAYIAFAVLIAAALNTVTSSLERRAKRR